MTTPLDKVRGPLRAVAESWDLHLRAEHKATSTIKTYLLSVAALDDWLRTSGDPYLASNPVTSVEGIDTRHFKLFMADLLSRASESTASTRYRALQQFFKWAVEEEEIEVSPMTGVRGPAQGEKVVPLVHLDDFTTLLKACAGKGFLARRDTAIIMLFIDTGMRHDEMTGIQLDGVDTREGAVLVTGKGNRQRHCPFGHATARALDRYMRERAKQPGKDLPKLWLAEYGAKPLGYFGINQMLGRRCKDAGLPPINPHRFRHVAAHEFLADGGRESDLMRLMGWKSQSMVRRYGASGADARARKAHRLHGLGDRLGA